uniref:Uncharacterized protein n=1 Tax=uncultured bacterium TB157_p TaxID=1552133 RepID=A0A0K0LCF0_9BACT|nr:hypothetical protein [uncultured bacterium TB157_p]
MHPLIEPLRNKERGSAGTYWKIIPFFFDFQGRAFVCCFYILAYIQMHAHPCRHTYIDIPIHVPTCIDSHTHTHRHTHVCVQCHE